MKKTFCDICGKELTPYGDRVCSMRGENYNVHPYKEEECNFNMDFCKFHYLEIHKFIIKLRDI